MMLFAISHKPEVLKAAAYLQESPEFAQKINNS